MAVGRDEDKAPTVEIAPAAETVVVVLSGEIDCAMERSGDSRAALDGGNDVVVPAMKEEGKVETSGEKENEGHAVDLEKGVGSWPTDGEKVCRICHLSSEMLRPVEGDWELITIGCGCKGELGIAHRCCAEAWFKVKGNRICEICGLNAKSIVGDEDDSFMEVWLGNINQTGAANNPNLLNQGSNWTSQRFCSFLVSFLVIAFVLQWYFRESFS